MTLKQHKQKLLQEDPDFKREWERFDLWFEIEQMILMLRSARKRARELYPRLFSGKADHE